MCVHVCVSMMCACVFVNEVKGIMKDNVNRVAERGDSLEDLQDKSGKRERERMCVCLCLCVLSKRERERECVCVLRERESVCVHVCVLK